LQTDSTSRPVFLEPRSSTAPAKPARSAPSLAADSNRLKFEFGWFLNSMRAVRQCKGWRFSPGRSDFRLVTVLPRRLKLTLTEWRERYCLNASVFRSLT
jgi:hypothetical protein